MPRRLHPAAAVMTFFRTQPQEVCDLTLAIIRDEMKMRFSGGSVPKTRKTRVPKQRDLPKEE